MPGLDISNAENAGRGFRLAHISDPHLSSLAEVRWQQLFSKRILGYLSWRFSRRHIHRVDILESLLTDLSRTRSQHLLVTGDLTHIGTPVECRQVATWLKGLGSPANISVIPGNHDRYSPDDDDLTTGLWSDYMKSDPGFIAGSMFPSFRKRGPLALIGLSTALPTAPFFASGRLGKTQLEKLVELLTLARDKGLFRVVALHHGPLLDSNRFRKRLTDAEQFREVIRCCGAELILHGHGHYPVNGWLDGNAGKVPVIGAASASLLSSSGTKRAGYNIYEVNTTARGWQVHMESRRYDAETGGFDIRQQTDFSLASGETRTAE